MGNRIKAIVRLVASVVFIANMVLTAKGCNPIPFDEATVTEVLTYIAGGLSTLWIWWKDAPITKRGNEAHDEMVLKKEMDKGNVQENFFDTAEEVK